MHYLEQIASAVRAEYGVSGYLGARAFAHIMQELVGSEYRPAPGASGGWCLHLPSGEVLVCADPLRVDVCLEELARALLSRGLADWLARHGMPTAERQRLREDADAARLARALALPPELMGDTDEWIAEDSGLPVTLVRRRRRDLAVAG